MGRSAIAMMTFGLAVTIGAYPRGALTSPLRSEPCGRAEGQAQQHRPPAAQMSCEETPGTAFARQWGDQEYEVRSSAEAMPADKWDYRPAAGLFKNEELKVDPTEVRTFAEQVKHVACSKPQRGPLRRPQHTHRPGRRVRVACRRPLRADGPLPAPEWHRAACDRTSPPKLKDSPGQFSR